MLQANFGCAIIVITTGVVIGLLGVHNKKLHRYFNFLI
jgi:hypothetical protein